ncbi:hypothetical protein [uncultured Robinsoniella sp.]|uniref:RDAC family protein n=1 Tax=uncultured Robinsoniella sp. TaxID=904190 RepID=UPI00374E46FB
MKIISIQDIIECNQMLKEKELAFKLHIRDACGKQSFWIEPLGSEGGEMCGRDMYQALDDFFGQRGCKIAYSEDKLNFWVE